MVRPPFALLGSLLLCCGPTAAQSDRPTGRRANIGGGVEVGIPLGEFADTWGREITGLSANIAVPMRMLPIDWGFDFAWGSMGGASRRVSVAGPSGPVNGELNVRSNVYGYHGSLRFRPIQGQVSPYVELLGGARHFSTRSRFEATASNEPATKERRASDVVASGGWAAGVLVTPKRSFYLEARLERLNGGEVEYVDPRTIAIGADGSVSFGTMTSNVRSLQVQIGVGFLY